MIKAKKWLKRCLWVLAILFILVNIIAFFHAYKLTHFGSSAKKKTDNSKDLPFKDKAIALFFGVNNPRPENKALPKSSFETIILSDDYKTACWSIQVENSKGTVILFHGYGGEKSGMLDKSTVFNSLGYNTLLVDFMGSGETEGYTTTIGFYEAKQVKACYDFIEKSNEDNIYLFGTSMGAVAIMKSITDFSITPKGIILECPFGTMYETVCARFNNLGIPSFPLADLLVFWGGIQNGFWAFSHNPLEYAKNISSPTLLLYGAKDIKVSRKEIDAIFENLEGPKFVSVYPNAGHENYLKKYGNAWKEDVESFLEN